MSGVLLPHHLTKYQIKVSGIFLVGVYFSSKIFVGGKTVLLNGHHQVAEAIHTVHHGCLRQGEPAVAEAVALIEGQPPAAQGLPGGVPVFRGLRLPEDAPEVGVVLRKQVQHPAAQAPVPQASVAPPV